MVVEVDKLADNGIVMLLDMEVDKLAQEVAVMVVDIEVLTPSPSRSGRDSRDNLMGQRCLVAFGADTL